jgi:hypothetical protein
LFTSLNKKIPQTGETGGKEDKMRREGIGGEKRRIEKKRRRGEDKRREERKEEKRRREERRGDERDEKVEEGYWVNLGAASI